MRKNIHYINSWSVIVIYFNKRYIHLQNLPGGCWKGVVTIAEQSSHGLQHVQIGSLHLMLAL